MGKTSLCSPKANAARKAKAAALTRFSTEIARLRTTWRWISRDVIHPESAEVDGFLAKVDLVAFLLAQDVESGRVELDLPDEPRPLFDRPATPTPVIARPTPVIEPATPAIAGPTPAIAPAADYLVKCNSCDFTRARSDASHCPSGHLGGWSYAGPIEAKAPVDPPESKPKPKRKPKKKADPVPPEDWEDPAGEVAARLDSPRREEPPAHSYEAHLEDDGSGNSTFLGVVYAASLAEAITLAPAQFAGDVVPGTPLVVTPSSGHVEGKFGPIAECLGCGKRRLKSEGEECPDCYKGPADGPSKEIDLISPTAVLMWPNSSDLPGPGDDWRSKSILDLRCPLGVENQKPKLMLRGYGVRDVGQAWDLIESGEISKVDQMTLAYARVIEQAIVKLRAEAGDPAPFTAPIEEEATADRKHARFLVKAAKGNPLYILEADSLERATAYVRDQHPDDSQTIEPIDPGGFPAKFPAWLATRGIPAHWQPGADLGSKPRAKPSRKRKETAGAR